jgi:predicted Zn-dependent protease with MMP-like domain
MDWTDAQAPTLDEIEKLAVEGFASLPDEFRALTGDVVFMVQDFPDNDVIEEMELETEFDILGLFSGPDLAAREGGSHAPQQTMIFLYRRPILDYWAEHDEALGAIITHVLVHEIGHHFGLSDDDMTAIEAMAD